LKDRQDDESSQDNPGTEIVPVNEIEPYRPLEVIEGEFVEGDPEPENFIDATAVDYVGSTIPISGECIAAVISHFCQKPLKGNDTSALCSIGVAKNSVVATDGRSAIRIGLRSHYHVATEMKEAEIEAFRAAKYGKPVRLDDIARRVSPTGTGEILQMPRIQDIIDSHLCDMQSLAVLDPKALVAIAKVAEKAGASSVELLRQRRTPGGSAPVIGFRFHYYVDQPSLEDEWTDQIHAEGVFMARLAHPEPEETIEETTVLLEMNLEMEDGETVKVTVYETNSKFAVAFHGPVNIAGTVTLYPTRKDIGEDVEGWALKTAQTLVNEFKAWEAGHE